MSKRCSAQHCFNSTLYTKNISYFCFPKNKQFADQWADLAGRSDLKEKPLNRVIKYFLCSEHFTAKCFHDKDTRQILKRDLPHSIAMPSIFKNNLQETLQISNPKQTIEVHNIVLLESEDVSKTKANTLPPPNNFVCYEMDSESINDEQSCELFETQVEVVQNLELLEQQMQSSEPKEDQAQEQTSAQMSTAYRPDLDQCRLCFKQLKNDEPITLLEDSLHLQEFISRVMSDKITLGDDFSQIVCKNCENNSLLCLIIIQQMDATQQKILSCNENLV